MEKTSRKYLQELRSDAVQDIIRYKPYWLVRWGTFLFSFFFLLLFTLSFFVKYPDIIKSSLKLTATETPKAIVSKATGKILKMFVKENDTIQINQTLAYIEALGNHEQILELSRKLNGLVKKETKGIYKI